VEQTPHGDLKTDAGAQGGSDTHKVSASSEQTGKEILTLGQKEQLETVLREEFELCEGARKGNTWTEHKIKLKHKEPIKQKYYPRHPKRQQIKDTHVKVSSECELSRNPICTATEWDWYKDKRAQVESGAEQSQECRIEQGKLYSSTTSEWKVCVPKDKRQQIISQNHDLPNAGHIGVAKTIKRIAQRYYWPKMITDIIKYVARCSARQKHKVPQQKHWKPPIGTGYVVSIPHAYGKPDT
jgi:hypothetical protein